MYTITYHGNFLPGYTSETQSIETSNIDAIGGDNYLTITGNNVGFQYTGNLSYDSSATFTLDRITMKSTTSVPLVTFRNLGATTTSGASNSAALVGDLATIESFSRTSFKTYRAVYDKSYITTSRDVSISGNPSPVVYSTFSNLRGAWRIPNDETISLSYTYTAVCNLTQDTTSISVPYDANGTYRYYEITTTTSSGQFTNAISSYTASFISESYINTNTSEYSTATGTFNASSDTKIAFKTIYTAAISNLYDYYTSTIGIDTAGTFVNYSSSAKRATTVYNYIYTRHPTRFTNPTTTYTTTSVFISDNGNMNSFNATVESSYNYTRVLSMDNVGDFFNVTVDFTTETSSTLFFTTNATSTIAYTYRFSNFNPIYEIESKTYEDKYSTITETSVAATILNIASTASTVGANIHISELEIEKTYNDWDYSYTESTSVISSTENTLTSALDVMTDLVSSTSGLSTRTDNWTSFNTSRVKYYAQYSATESSVAYVYTSSVSNSWKDTYTTSELRSSSIYRNSNSATIYSTINLSYTLTDDRIDYSTTYSGSSTTSEVFNSLNIYSTYSGYEMSQTVDIDGNYTYHTTYFGTLEAGILDTIFSTTSSWLNIAAVSTSSSSNTSINYGSGQYLKAYSYGSTSSFGVSGYNLTYISLYSTYQESLNSPTLISTRGTSSSSTSYSSLEKGVINTSFYTDKFSSTTYSKFTLEDYATSFWVNYNLSVSTILSGTSINSYTYTNSNSYSSTAYNTSDYGSTARLSSLVSSKNWVNMFNTYLADNYAYTYNVSSVWNYNNSITETLSEYSTALATSFKKTYATRYNYDSYSYTKSSRTNVLTTEDRFINRNGITNYSTVNVYITNTVAVYNNSTMATMSSITSSNVNNTSRSISVIDYTFISDINDFTSSDSVVDTFTTSNTREQFNNSISTVISSTMEQQNDTLVFKSENATFSTYNTSATYSTISTLEINYEATTYTEEYSPISYTVSSTIQSTSLTAGTILRSTSESVIHTQSVEYTPIYTTVDGIYMTTN